MSDGGQYSLVHAAGALSCDPPNTSLPPLHTGCCTPQHVTHCTTGQQASNAHCAAHGPCAPLARRHSAPAALCDMRKAWLFDMRSCLGLASRRVCTLQVLHAPTYVLRPAGGPFAQPGRHKVIPPLRQCTWHSLLMHVPAAPLLPAAQAQASFGPSDQSGRHKVISPEMADAGTRWLAAWLAAKYEGVGKTEDEALPGECAQNKASARIPWAAAACALLHPRALLCF